MSDDLFESPDEGKMGEDGSISVRRDSTVTDSLDSIFRLLSNSRCRYLLYHLFTVDGEIIEFEAAANVIYRYEMAGAEAEIQSSREDVQLELHHNLLPRLEAEGVLEYDTRQGTIRFTESPALEEWVKHAEHKELQ